MIVNWPFSSQFLEAAACTKQRPAVLAIGVFDGLHQGHQFLLGEAIGDAKRRSAAAWVITFSSDPDELFKPTEQLSKLSSNDQRLARLEQSGVCGVLSITFNQAVAALEPSDFLDNLIGAGSKQLFLPQAIHVGSDFRFGVQASGGVHDLTSWARAHDCVVNAHHLLCDHGLPVTATRIRHLLFEGKVAEA